MGQNYIEWIAAEAFSVILWRSVSLVEELPRENQLTVIRQWQIVSNIDWIGTCKSSHIAGKQLKHGCRNDESWRLDYKPNTTNVREFASQFTYQVLRLPDTHPMTGEFTS